ncbi:MAG: ubiquinol-cytochrome c reductase iron-sulfur subunit [Nitrospinaceae bacterium]
MTDSTPTSPATVSANRRTFIKWSIYGLLAAFFAGAVNVVVRYLIPPPPKKKTGKLSIPVSQIPLGGAQFVDYRGSPAVIIHTEKGYVAFSAVCTHLGCIVKWMRNEKIFYCPCHGGKFDNTGKVLAGPPPEPLHKINIEVRDDSINFV